MQGIGVGERETSATTGIVSRPPRSMASRGGLGSSLRRTDGVRVGDDERLVLQVALVGREEDDM